VNCTPLFNYGTIGGTWPCQGGYESTTVAPHKGNLQLKITGTIPLGVLSSRCQGHTTIAAGESAVVTLAWGETTFPLLRTRHTTP